MKTYLRDIVEMHAEANGGPEIIADAVADAMQYHVLLTPNEAEDVATALQELHSIRHSAGSLKTCIERPCFYFPPELRELAWR